MPLRKSVCCALALMMGVALSACSGLFSSKTDYKSAAQLPPLDVPPDLIRPGADDRYKVPESSPLGATTFSNYSKERGQQRSGASGVLPELQNVRVARDGNQRWLVVNGTPEQIWPAVKDFWQEAGFIVNVEVPEAGIMETDWAENRARVDAGMLRNLLSKLLDTIYSSAERDKFRTRLERGGEPATTEVFVSHRGMVEVFVSSPSSDRADTAWQPRPPDPSLEAEMLGRLMVRLGVESSSAKSQLATAQTTAPRATLLKGGDGASTLTLNEQFDRAWRRVGLALDRVGFTVEDRDRSKGLYFVRYIDPQVDNKSADKGFLSKLKFWGGSSKPKIEQFRIQVRDVEATTGSRVNVLSKEGAQESSETAGRILALLYEQLK
jgi:outer membrane protein assembly factor BamC